MSSPVLSRRLALQVGIAQFASVLLGRTLRAGQGAPSDKAAQKALPEIPADLIDPAFEGKLDLAAVRQAIANLDAKGLMDQAEKLLMAERQLGKKHRSLTFGALVELALRITADQKDFVALDYIAKALARLEVKDFAEQLAATNKQFDVPRAISAGPNVPLSETTPEGIVLYNALLRQIKTAQLVGDRRALTSIRQKIQKLRELHPKQVAHLIILCDGAIASLKPDSSVATLTLGKLTAALYDD